MSQDNRQRQSPLSRIPVATAIAVAIVVLAVACLMLDAHAKDNPDDFTRVYAHTYDEVFQAAQTAVERLGWFVTSQDKDKGVVVVDYGKKHYLEVHLETVSAKPETRLTIVVFTCRTCSRRIPADMLFSELQKVLATY